MFAISLAAAALGPSWAAAADGTDAPAHDDGAAREASRAAFKRGVVLAKEGDFEGAHDAFVEAFRLFPHPSILLNLGIARAKTGRYVEAELDLVTFLDSEGVTPDEAQSARAVLADVRAHLATLSLEVTPEAAEIAIDGRPVTSDSGKAEIRAGIGRHELRVAADGHEPHEETLSLPAGGAKRTIALAERRRAPSASAAATGESSTFPDRSHLGWGALGLGVAAAGFGTFAGLRAITLADEYASTRDPSTKSTGTTFRTLADVSFIAAAAGVGVGLYLLLVPASRSKPIGAARLVVGPNYGAFTGSF